MTKLNDTQLILLCAAAQRDDRGVATIDDRPETRTAITKLLKAKLLQTVARSDELALWETNEDGATLGLAITAAGLRAIGDEDGDAESTPVPAPTAGESRVAPIDPGKKQAAGKAKTPGATDTPTGKSAKATRDAAASPVRVGTKLATVIGLLHQPKGASISDLMVATDWQAHSVRGALSGALKKKLGLNVISEVVAEVRRYRIAG